MVERWYKIVGMLSEMFELLDWQNATRLANANCDEPSGLFTFDTQPALFCL